MATCVAGGGAVRCIVLARENLVEPLGIPASELWANTWRDLNTSVGLGHSVPLCVLCRARSAPGPSTGWACMTRRSDPSDVEVQIPRDLVVQLRRKLLDAHRCPVF